MEELNENQATVEPLEEEETEEQENEELGEDEAIAVVQDGMQQTIVVEAPKPEALPEVTQPLIPIVLNPKNSQVDAWVKVVDTLRKLGMSKATFTYNGNLHVRQIDSARVAMVDAEIDMGLGISALVTEKPVVIRTFSVDLMHLKRALRMYEPTISIGETEAVFSGTVTDVSLPLDQDEEQPPMPMLQLSTSTNASLNSLFSEMIKYLPADKAPIAIIIKVANGKLTFKSENDDNQKFEMRGFTAEGPDATSTYGTQLLKAFREAGYGNGWKLSFGTDTPIKAQQTITRTEYNKGESTHITVATITAFVAPRIETDE